MRKFALMAVSKTKPSDMHMLTDKAGWQQEDRSGLSDLCAYRKLLASNSPELRRAVARAEVVAGRKIDPRMVSAGVHSHDDGKSFHPGH